MISEHIDLTAEGGPYKVFMDISYDVRARPEAAESRLFAYQFVLLNSKGERVSSNSSVYTHLMDTSEDAESPTGRKSNTLTTLTLGELPDDSYVLNVSLTPTPDKPADIILDTYRLSVKSNVQLLNPLLPLFGVGLLVAGFVAFPRKKGKPKTQEEQELEDYIDAKLDD